MKPENITDYVRDDRLIYETRLMGSDACALYFMDNYQNFEAGKYFSAVYTVTADGFRLILF